MADEQELEPGLEVATPEADPAPAAPAEAAPASEVAPEEAAA